MSSLRSRRPRAVDAAALSRLPLLIPLLPALVLILSSCAATESDPWFRRPEPQGQGTAFSALDLPPGNRVRSASGAPGPDYWQQRADYAIEASLDPASRVIEGRERITYTNNAPDALTYVWLALEQNIFRADSLGTAVSTRAAVGGERSEGEGCTIKWLRLAPAAGGEGAAGADLSYHVYDTQARVDLPAPLAAGGGTLELDIGWEFTVPEKVFRRFGIEKVEQGTIFEIAQWFPALAVYDDVHGWNTLPYLGTGEFYTNFGDFDVKLTVPREQVVVATGELQNAGECFTPEQVERLQRARSSAETIVIRGADEVGQPESRPAGEGALTWHFKAKDVRTFAWACSEAFILDAAGLDGVLLQSAYPKEAVPLWESSTQMLRKAIDGYNRRWFRYPYPVATNVNGIEGGMEYPMIVFCKDRKGEESLYGVTTHEIGHNWFPMTVNTDERRHAWMDEGFNTFINHYSRADWFGDEGEQQEKNRKVRGDPAAFAPSMLNADLVPIDTPADQLPRRLLGQLEYTKTAVALVLLREQVLGPERFDAAFREYIRRWAFRSPRPADFFRTMEDAAGADLAWFWRGWFLGTGYLDQAVDSVTQATPERNNQPAQPARVTLANRGELVMPVVLRLRFADGTEETRRLPVQEWFLTNRISEPVKTEQPIVSVEIDPEQEFPDVDRGNNVWRAAGWER